MQFQPGGRDALLKAHTVDKNCLTRKAGLLWARLPGGGGSGGRRCGSGGRAHRGAFSRG